MKLFSVIATLLPLLLSNCYRQNDIVENSSSLVCILPIQEQPSFPGGIDSLKNFIKMNLEYPGGGMLCCEGSIYVSFVVKEDGGPSDFKIVRGACGELFNQNAIAVLEKMPKWNPGKQNDMPVKVRCVYPVKFGI